MGRLELRQQPFEFGQRVGTVEFLLAKRFFAPVVADDNLAIVGLDFQEGITADEAVPPHAFATDHTLEQKAPGARPQQRKRADWSQGIADEAAKNRDEVDSFGEAAKRLKIWGIDRHGRTTWECGRLSSAMTPRTFRGGLTETQSLI